MSIDDDSLTNISHGNKWKLDFDIVVVAIIYNFRNCKTSQEG